MSGGWNGSQRRAALPPDWSRIRAAVLQRDHHRCQWWTAVGICGNPATDADHIGDPNDHRPGNLQALCGWHHRRKTSAQGNQSPRRDRPSEQRPTEGHPGMITD